MPLYHHRICSRYDYFQQCRKRVWFVAGRRKARTIKDVVGILAVKEAELKKVVLKQV